MPKKRPKAEDWTDPTGLLLLQSWAQQGLSQEEICTNMERLRGVPIAPRTLRRWIAKYPATIGVAFNNGREASIAIVENALFRKHPRATWARSVFISKISALIAGVSTQSCGA